MRTSLPVTINLKDYIEPAYEVERLNLTFELDLKSTRVTSVAKYKLKEGKAREPLTLDGVDLTLESIEVDGTALDESQYTVTDETLVFLNPGKEFELKIVNYISPVTNSALEGLYRSGDMYCTQCEAQGFRRITYFMDRPDVMTSYTTKVIANKKENPVLLSNGNPIASGDLEGGKHFVEWEDPFKKPTYLFALVAGDLGLVEGSYTTMSARVVDLRIYCDKGNEDKCHYTLECLKKSMQWDEERFGLEYDLDIYMIVAVDSFNMGAMENKGLNIFNSKYVLASPDTATDKTYYSIEAIVGHEYFHNWTGNRVTCRDWFQLTLKEGLTVFRDQEFSSDLNSRSAARVKAMTGLRIAQFVEDAGPNSHPIKPKSYVDINNFYSRTVYEKGAEIIRMYHTLLGEEGFRKGMDKYFELYDGMAVTTEDFLHAMSVANGNYDLSDFSRWYDQSGTPTLKVSSAFDRDSKELTVKILQINPETADQKEKKPLFMPFKIGLIDSGGRDIKPKLKLCGGTSQSLPQPQIADGIIHISAKEQEFVFEGLSSEPVLSLNRNFSAPVDVEYEYSEVQLAFLMSHDSDPVARYNACQILLERAILATYDGLKNANDLGVSQVSQVSLDAISTVLDDEKIDDQLRSLSLSLPALAVLAQRFETLDFVRLNAAREAVASFIANKFSSEFSRVIEKVNLSKEYAFNPTDMGERQLLGLALSYLAACKDSKIDEKIYSVYQRSDNMTNRLSAFNALVAAGSSFEDKVTNDFYQFCQGSNVALQEWMRGLCSSPSPGTLKRLERAQAIAEFDMLVPNHVNSTVAVFGYNTSHFHAEDGSGYRLIADYIIKLDGKNSQVAAGLATLFEQFKKLEPKMKEKMRSELLRIKGVAGLSKGTFEIVNKTLGV